MKLSILFDLLKLLLVGIAIWAFFYFFPLFPNTDTLDISFDNEEKLGKLIVDNIISLNPSFKEIHTPPLDSALNEITSRLIEKVGLTEYEYRIRVVDNPDINAVTLPGGYIFVFRGLIEFSDSPEELAAVLAHEIGHVEKRHIVSKMVKEFGITVMISVLSGGDNVMLSELGRAVMSSAFDRKQERDADCYGLDLLVKSNVSPKSMAVFFRKLNRKSDTVEKFSENLEFLMSHPHNNSRIKASIEYVLPDLFKPEPFLTDWKRVRKSVGKK